jgi:hypothetical protein
MDRDGISPTMRPTPKEDVPVTRHSHRLIPLVLAFACCGLAACAASASTPVAVAIPSLLGSSALGTTCGATQAVFAPWGDTHQYYFTQSGGFESGAPGWTLSGGARVVAGNEPFYIHSKTDDSSLLIPSGGVAISPPLCFGLNTPGIRFFATSNSGPSTIHVQVIANGPLGLLSILDGGPATVGTSWAPTPVFSTTLSQLSGATSIQLKITSTGNVQIDDIYIDPFVSH